MSQSESRELVLHPLDPPGWVVGRFAALELPELIHAVTTRRGPDVNEIMRDPGYPVPMLLDALHLKGLAWSVQVHGIRVMRVDAPGCVGECDGLMTDVPSLGLMMRSADCPLILLYAPDAGAIGIAHASWRSTVQQMAARLVASVARTYHADPAKMTAAICPSAGPCCYEVGEDVLTNAKSLLGPPAEDFFQCRDGKRYFDLWQSNVHQLLTAGLERPNIHLAGICTLCENECFPSYRLEGDSAGRFVAVIAKR
jgi:hypothetical protein